MLSIGLFFSLMIAGLAQHLPAVMVQGLVAHGVPAADAGRIAALPPVGVLFAAFLGENPIRQLLGNVAASMPPDQVAFLTGRSFFPQLISGPFADGLTAAFWLAVLTCLGAAIASWFTGAQSPGIPSAGRTVTERAGVGRAMQHGRLRAVRRSRRAATPE